jgi:uncharacterized protein with beta-barrel porin domain
MHFRLSSRGALLCAGSAFSFVATPAVAQSIPVGVDPVATEQIIANHEVTPLGPPSVLPGINNIGQQEASVYSNSPQVLDPAGSINGVGQQIAVRLGNNVTGIGGTPINAVLLSLCTGSLINPRTVITAAHCLYTAPAHQYGAATGTGGGIPTGFGIPTSQGIPLSFGFESLNRNCLNASGLPATCPAGQKGPYETWRDSGYQTSVDRHIYNANQVWYGTGAQPVALGGLGEFANQDIALVTFDTHVQDIPTWALLFSPLEGPAHVTITGYGGAGVGLSAIGSLASIDYRRRSAENMIDALITNHDWRSSPVIQSNASAGNDHSIYWLDFDDPDFDPENLPANFFVNTNGPPAPGQPPANPCAPGVPPSAANGYCGRNSGYYDFNGFGGTALPNEGSTAGGDSGGPLIVDQTFTDANGNFVKVVAGVLTGSWSFNGGVGTYGQFNVYPPLFPFWEEIVQNNPYKYVSAKVGDGDWFDPAHWVQDMDPNFMVIGPDGNLVNALPSTPQGGADVAVNKFGTFCFLGEDCATFDGPANPQWNGTSHVTAGGPGSTNFVPNNVEPVNSATPGATVRARYYDVTLREAGTTTLSQAATIDKMTVDEAAKLKIAGPGTLNVWADYHQISGWSQVDGTLNVGGDMLVVSGLLSGNGTINSDFLTVVAGVVAPGGGDKVGALNVGSDMILASASSYFVDVARSGADLLAVDGVLALNDGAIVFNKVTDAPAPRHSDVYTIATADLVDGTFGTAYTFQGVLRPQLTYADTNVEVNFVAGSLAEILDGGSATEIAFANALDTLRSSSYTSLWNLYGSIDWMNGAQLSTALSALTPRIIGDATILQQHQSKLLTNSVTDRLSLLGSGRASGLTVSGTPLAGIAAQGSDGFTAMQFGSSSGRSVTIDTLPKGITGFVSGGLERTRSTYGEKSYSGQGAWHMAMGLEMPLGEGRIGTAAGYAEGASTPGGDSNRSKTTMAAAYAAMPVGDGFYVGGMFSAETARAALERNSYDGISALRYTGATSASRYSAVAEAGWVTDIGSGLTLTPRAQLAYGRYKLDGFNERGGETALRIDDVKLSRLEARLGAKLEGSTSLAGFTIKPQISADYVSLLSGRNIDATVRFAAAPDVAIALPLTTSGSGWAEVKGGVTIGDGPVTLGLSGQHAVGASEISDQRAQADLKIRF